MCLHNPSYKKGFTIQHVYTKYEKMMLQKMICFQVYKTVELIKAKGGKVSREPGPVKGGKSVIAFIEDPDGYKFELIQRGPTPEPLCQVMLRVGDLDRAIKFYEKVCLCVYTRFSENIYGSFLFFVHILYFYQPQTTQTRFLALD